MKEARSMTCEEAVRRFFAYLDRALSGESLEVLEAHLEECLDCCDRLQFSRRLDAFVASVGEARMPDGLADRIRRGIARASWSAAAAGRR
jgi:anti-sigma factor (TIGR02949 family)